MNKIRTMTEYREEFYPKKLERERAMNDSEDTGARPHKYGKHLNSSVKKSIRENIKSLGEE